MCGTWITYYSVWSALPFLLSLEALSWISTGKLTLEKNPGRYLEVSSHTLSDHGLQTVALNRHQPWACYCRLLSSQLPLSFPLHISHSFTVSCHKGFGASLCHVLKTRVRMGSVRLAFPTPLVYFCVNLSRLHSPSVVGAGQFITDHRCPDFFNSPFTLERLELAAKYSLKWVNISTSVLLDHTLFPSSR